MDQAEDACITDPMLQESDQPSLADRVAGTGDRLPSGLKGKTPTIEIATNGFTAPNLLP
jgi:hypothetical protein